MTFVPPMSAECRDQVIGLVDSARRYMRAFDPENAPTVILTDGIAPWQVTVLSIAGKWAEENSPQESEVDSSLSPVSPISKLLDLVYSHSKNGRAIRGSDLVFNTFYSWLNSGNISVCDCVLALAQPEKMVPDIMISFLTISLRAKDELKYRPDYFSKVFAEYTKLRGEGYAHAVLDKWK